MNQRRQSLRRQEERERNKQEEEKELVINIDQVQRLQEDQRDMDEEIDNNNGREQVIRLMEEIQSDPQDQQLNQEEHNQFSEFQEEENQVQNISPQRFLLKIPNSDVLRDFFANEGKFYVPPKRDLTSAFCKVYFQISFFNTTKDILSGKKKLMKLSSVHWVEEIPRWPELTAKKIWERGLNNPNFKLYFPNYKPNKYPQRRYLLNIANTVSPNSIVDLVLQIRLERQKNLISEEPIKMTNEFLQLFSQFKSMTTNKRKGRMKLITRNYDQCPLCLLPMKSYSTIGDFKCKTHKAHKKCLQQYYQSNYGMNEKYACPLRCPFD